MHDDDFNKGKRGEFSGDFTRDSFDPTRHYSRVLMQQGRVQLDADWNEQVSILVAQNRQFIIDFIGPHAAPVKDDGKPGDGFLINKAESADDFSINSGGYYVHGIFCENLSSETTFLNQPDYPIDPDDSPLKNDNANENGNHLIYLDVWERHINHVEDDYIREKALLGVDTTSRAKIIWQVKTKETTNTETRLKNYEGFLAEIIQENRTGTGLLKARARKASKEDNSPCLISPDARYRGKENQLYRVQVHADSNSNSGPTFKWSRENASVIFPVVAISGNKITLSHLGRDCRYGLKANDWVELVDDDYTLLNQAHDLLQVESIDSDNFTVTLTSPAEIILDENNSKHCYLRRWDQTNGKEKGIKITEGVDNNHWLLLEDGIEVQFQSHDENQAAIYQTGDYWLIPARTTTGDVEWPGPVENPAALPAQGIQHYYAPLALRTLNTGGDAMYKDLRRKISKNWS